MPKLSVPNLGSSLLLFHFGNMHTRKIYHSQRQNTGRENKIFKWISVGSTPFLLPVSLFVSRTISPRILAKLWYFFPSIQPPAHWLMEEFSLFFTLIDKSRIDHVLLRHDDHRYHCSDPMIPKTPVQDSSKYVGKIFKDRYMNVHLKFKSVHLESGSTSSWLA